MEKNISEKEFLDKVADTYSIGASDVWRRESYILHYKEYLSSNDIAMELGCSDGYTAIVLSKYVNQLDVIDGSQKMLKKLEQRIYTMHIDNINPIYKLFEEIKFET